MTTRIAMLLILTALLIALDLPGHESRTNAVPAGNYLADPGHSISDGVIEVRIRGRAKRLYLPIAPSYRYYDYPYYERRGHFPKHIRPGFVYYGFPYSHYVGRPYPRYGGRCSYWHRKCLRARADRREHNQGMAKKFGACTCP